MHRLTASALAFAGTSAAAALAAVLMAGNAMAQTPAGLSRADVRAQVLQSPGPAARANEWALQQNDPRSPSGLTRQQVKADYIAHRDQVHASTGEDSGSLAMPLAIRLTPAQRTQMAARKAAD